MADFESNLPLLWDRFNADQDYPVLIFSEGLRGDTKRRLLKASPNRLWFFVLEDLLELPGELTSDPWVNSTLHHAQHVSVGYRAQARWKAGPMFEHPVFGLGERIRYIWWIDYDSYLPAALLHDPFDRMHRQDLAFGYTHWGTDARGSSRHFWEYTRLYMDAKGLHTQISSALRRLHNEEGEHRGDLIMNDNELLDVRWFATGDYQDFFRYIDALQGIWLHRWGDHLIRTFGAAMFLPEKRWVELDIPYAHQDICLCGSPGAKCVQETDAARPGKGWRWRCDLV